MLDGLGMPFGKSLVQSVEGARRPGPRFMMLETIREFAQGAAGAVARRRPYTQRDMPIFRVAGETLESQLFSRARGR